MKVIYSINPILKVLLTVGAGMTAYEFLKQLVIPNISIWESHTITIVFSSIVAAVATNFALKKYRDIENQLRRSHDNLETRVETRTAQLKETNVRLRSEIREKENAHMEIRKLNTELEERVRSRTIQLQKMNKKLEKSLEKEIEINKMKTVFTDMVSHEYRTPLTVILSSSYLVETALEKQRPDLLPKYLKMIRESVDTMTNLIDDVLTLGKAEEGQTVASLNVFDLSEQCENILQEIRMIDLKKHIYYFDTTLKECNIKSDQKIVKQIIVNLLVNAQKYSEPGTEIKLQMDHTKKNINIRVIDEGCGIAEKDMQHIFEPFYRCKKDIGIVSGTGLGLAIVRKFADIIGASVSVSSKLGHGTEFCLSLNFNNCVNITEKLTEAPLQDRLVVSEVIGA